MSQKTFFVVFQNTDRTEGRGYEVPIHVCSIEATAIRLAKGAGVQGSDASYKEIVCEWNGTWAIGPVTPVRPSTADEVAEQDLIRRRNDKMRRDIALARAKDLGLSDEDIEALRKDIR